MTATAAVLAAWSAALALGGMAFFSFVIAPLVFSRLPAATAGTLIRATFAHYYLYVIATAALAALALLPARAWAPAAAMALVALLGLYARQLLMPEINRLRDAELAGDSSAGAAFASRHRFSVAINAVQLVLVAGVVAARAWG